VRVSRTLPRSVRVILAAAGASALLAGCVDSNSRATVGESIVLPAMQPSAPIPDEYPQDGSSLTGLDRSNWTAMTFLVPVDGTHHRPTYADAFFIADVTRRQRGEYPTLESALDLDGSKYGDCASQQRFAEGFLVPARAMLDAVAMPVRLVGEPQTWEYVSPKISYERQPKNRSLLLPPPAEIPIRPETDHGDAAVAPPQGEFPQLEKSEDPR